MIIIKNLLVLTILYEIFLEETTSCDKYFRNMAPVRLVTYFLVSADTFWFRQILSGFRLLGRGHSKIRLSSWRPSSSWSWRPSFGRFYSWRSFNMWLFSCWSSLFHFSVRDLSVFDFLVGDFSVCDFLVRDLSVLTFE